jgi:hypothetical protein
MLRHLDIKLVVIASLGLAAYCLVILLQNFGLNNVPDENVVYINPAVGGIEADDLETGEVDAPKSAEEADGLEDLRSDLNGG